MTSRRLSSFDDIVGPIINCSGLGAAGLAGDETVFPIRGQVVAVEASAVTDGITDESDQNRITYVYPRTNEVILGGTRQVGVEDRTPDASETKRILADAARLDSRLLEASVIESRVGLRPGRSTVRLESETESERLVIHNYGHGGHGYVLSWGCAEAVVSLLMSEAT